nr:MAG TPA: hypothetical protein [Caudoviricetes sp.]
MVQPLPGRVLRERSGRWPARPLHFRNLWRVRPRVVG